MTNTRKMIETLLLAADDVPLATKMHVLHCLDCGRLPTLVVSGPLYLNATRAAEVMGIGRTSFYKAAEFHRFPQHEISEGHMMFFAQDLLVHVKKDGLSTAVPEAMGESASAGSNAVKPAA